MRIKITGGELEAEIIEGSLDVEDVRKLLKKTALTDYERRKAIIEAPVSEPTDDGLGKLGRKPKVNI